MPAPLHKREDVVYRRSGAEIGRLEAFKISGARQVSAGVFEYEVIIHQRPPARLSTGDRTSSRVVEPRLWFPEAELITLCEALNLMVARLDTQVRGVDGILTGECASVTDEAVPEPGAPRFNIDDRVWVAASARIGFFEDDIVVGVKEIGIQPGSKRARFVYKLRRTSLPHKVLIYREDELITQCEAARLVRAELGRQLAEAQALQQAHCVS